MKTILITGAGGFLGSRLARRFTEAWEPRQTVTLPDGTSRASASCTANPASLWRVHTLSGRDPDIRDRRGLERLFHDLNPDYVIHCAAISDTGRCQREPDASYEINVTGAENVAAACRFAGAKLIFCSSDQVYFSRGGSNPGLAASHRETESLSPAGVYGCQKLEAEGRCAAACPDTVSLRLSWMYDTGAPGPEKHGDFYRTLRQGLRRIPGEPPLSFPVNDFRSITHAAYIGEQMEAVFSLPPGIYNLGSPNSRSTFDTAAGFLKLMGVPASGLDRYITPDISRFADSPRNLCMDMGKMAGYGIVLPETLEGFSAVLRTLHP